MASGKLEILSRKKDESQIGTDDEWDDSALIAAYDKAMNKAKIEVAKKKNIPYKSPAGNDQKSKKKVKWNVGDYCQAVFSEDGLYYEAIINEINESNDSCTIQFVGYGNEEETTLSALAPSVGRFERQRQEEIAKSQEQNGDYDDAESSSYSEEESVRKRRGESKKGQHHSVQSQKEPVPDHRCYVYKNAQQCNVAPVPAYPPHPPPPALPTPPPLLMDRVGPEDDKLYSMLLSWYMSGYHTGFYMGSRQAHSSPGHLTNMYYGR